MKKMFISAASISTSLWIVFGPPVIVEADIIKLQKTAEVEDAFLQTFYPNNNYGTTSYVSTFNRYISKFNLPEEVMNKEIVSAKIAVYIWNQLNFQPNQYMYLYNVISSWQEGSVTYNTTPSYNPTPIASLLHLSGSANWDHTFYPAIDITALVQGWANNTINNNGVLLSNELSATTIGLTASEYENNARTYLEITTAMEPVPEPTTMFLLGSGILGLAGFSRKEIK